MLKRIDRLILCVSSLPSALHYYRDILGLKLLRLDQHAAALAMEDGRTELILRTDPEGTAEQISIEVDDVRDLYRRREQLQLKFANPPQQVGGGYRATVRDPFGNVLPLVDRAGEGAMPRQADAPAAGLFAGMELPVPAKRQILVSIYQEIGRTADDLPYTPQFEKLYGQYCAQQTAGEKPTRREVWRHLLNLRKGGKLPKLGEAPTEAPAVSAEHERRLREMLGDDIGRRDRLPYTERFDSLVDEFNKTQARPLSPHLVWRLVAKLAK